MTWSTCTARQSEEDLLKSVHTSKKHVFQRILQNFDKESVVVYSYDSMTTSSFFCFRVFFIYSNNNCFSWCRINRGKQSCQLLVYLIYLIDNIDINNKNIQSDCDNKYLKIRSRIVWNIVHKWYQMCWVSDTLTTPLTK